MSSKPKLLITMGCSYTEGVGCWDHNLIPSGMTRKNTWDEKYNKIYLQNIDNFHEKGWPNKLGQKLNYDKVVNIGLAGSSNSAQFKLFMEKFDDKDLSKYDVLVVWLLTEPSRFSFYKGGSIHSVLPGRDYQGDAETMGSSYVDFIVDPILDPVLETIFYIKTFSHVCKNKGFGLILTYWEENSGDHLVNQYTSPHYLYDKPHRLLPPWPYGDPYVSPVCSHPNENGYELLAENIFKGIKKNHPQYVCENKPKLFGWQWDGEVEVHRMYFDKPELKVKKPNLI